MTISLSRIVFAIVLILSSATLNAGVSNACWVGVLENVKVGDSLASIFDRHSGIALCGGEFKGAKHGNGYVLCAYPNLRIDDKYGRRVLIADGKVVATRNGGGRKNICSWNLDNSL